MFTRAVVKLFGGIWAIRRKYRSTRIKFLARMYEALYLYFLKLNGSWISLSARIDGEPCFPHGIYGVFISGGAVIGTNCVIFQHVTIGSNTFPDSKGLGVPVIGENCYIGAGAKIIGNVRVGNNVRVGANAIVYQDVPDNCVVTSGIQKITAKGQPLNNKFYQKHKTEWRFFDNGVWKYVLDTSELNALKRFHENE